jgi:hypothetical protein
MLLGSAIHTGTCLSSLQVFHLLPFVANVGSVALRGARVKVGGTVSPLVSDPVGVTPPVGRIVVLRTDLSRRRASALCGSCAQEATENESSLLFLSRQIYAVVDRHLQGYVSSCDWRCSSSSRSASVESSLRARLKSRSSGFLVGSKRGKQHPHRHTFYAGLSGGGIVGSSLSVNFTARSPTLRRREKGFSNALVAEPAFLNSRR